MASAKVSPLASRPQFAAANKLDTRDIAIDWLTFNRRCSLYLAVIQQPVRKWEKPWRHQRAIALFAKSAEEIKLRLQIEGRLRNGEQCLQIIQAGE
jgi:hypothetical protein